MGPLNLALRRARRCDLRTWSADMIELIQSYEYVSGLRAVGRTEHPGGMELVDDPGRSTVPHLEATLKKRRRPLLVLHNYLCRFAEKFVALADVGVVTVRLSCLERFLRANRLENVRLSLSGVVEPDAFGGKRRAFGFAAALVPVHQTLGLVAGQIRALEPRRL